jgi:hypothetical protein
VRRGHYDHVLTVGDVEPDGHPLALACGDVERDTDRLARAGGAGAQSSDG